MAAKRIGILTGGGDVPGLNSVIKTVVYRGSEIDCEVVGIRRGWEGLTHVNLEDPLRPSPAGFDTTDLILDAVVEPHGSAWRWKDEDELREAVRRGLFDRDDVEALYEAGRRGVAHVIERRPPFDRDWEGWRPDPSWPLPELPGGWDRPQPSSGGSTRSTSS